MRRALAGAKLAVALSMLLIGLLGGARADTTPAERRELPYTGNLPRCDDPGVLSRITDRFHQKEAEYWFSSLQIVSFDHVGQIGYRTTGLSVIPRRYCKARAYVNDNRYREVVYWIGEDLGMIGWGYGVEWCVVGLDRNWAYGPACRAAYP